MKIAFPNLVSSADFVTALFVPLSRYFQRISNNVDNYLKIKVRGRSFISFLHVCFFLRIKGNMLSIIVFNTLLRKKKTEVDFIFDEMPVYL